MDAGASLSSLGNQQTVKIPYVATRHIGYFCMQHLYIELMYEYAIKKRELLVPYLIEENQIIPETFLFPKHLRTDEDEEAYESFILASIRTGLGFNHIDVINKVEAELQTLFEDYFHIHLVSYAIEVAKFFHGDPEAKDHKRNTGEPYIEHPLAVYDILTQVSDRYLDFGDHEKVEVLAAAILHDTLEGTKALLGMLITLFGQRTAYLVCGCTKVEVLKNLDLPISIFNPAHTTREHLISSSAAVQDIKTADAIHNLSCFIKDKDGYAPIYANRKRRLHKRFELADPALTKKLFNLIVGKALC